MASNINLFGLLNYSLKSTDSGNLDSLTRFVQDAEQLSANKNFKFASKTEVFNFLGLSQQLQFLLQFDKSQKRQISRGEVPAALAVASVVKKLLPKVESLAKPYITPKPFLTILEKGDRKAWFPKKAERLTEDSLTPKPFLTVLEKGDRRTWFPKKTELLTEDTLAPKPLIRNLGKGTTFASFFKKTELLTQNSLDLPSDTESDTDSDTDSISSTDS